MTNTQKIPADMPFETALAELEQVVKALESGQVSLEDSIAAYERGVALRAVCENKLKAAQLKVDKLIVSPTGDVTGQEPFVNQG